MYRLLTRDSLKDELTTSEELRAKVVPLACDPRSEAKALLSELWPDCMCGFSVADVAISRKTQ